MKNKLFAVLLTLNFAIPAFGQTVVDTLSWGQFKEVLMTYHPIVARANLNNSLAKARLLQAWGNFEPKLSYNYDQKRFDGTNYYRFSTPEVKLPLWYGVELKGNFSEAEGAYLNPENKLPQEGLSFVGLNISLGKGLLMDKRRAVMKQARIFTEATTNEQLRILNDLVFEAGEAYLNWQNQYRISQVFEQALALSTVRYQAVKEGLSGGDRPAIDTVEALTQLQQREVQLLEARLELQNSLYEISSFLWLPENQPVDPQKLSIVPQRVAVILPGNPDASINNNPKLISYGFKLRDLEIERRLKAENLRPTIDLQLGILNSGSNAFRNLNVPYGQNNNKIGIQVAFPLTFATARGELAEARIKLRDTRLEESLVRNDLNVKLNQNNAEKETLRSQLVLIRQLLEANQKLLEGEELRFKFGDSSLFLVNARESKLLEIQEKLIETENKIRKNWLKGEWIVGGLIK